MSLVLNVEILGEYKKLTQATKGASKQLQGISKTTQKISGVMSGALAAIGVGFSLNAVVDGVKSVVTAASDLGEATNAINVAFGKSAKGIAEFGDTAAQAVGLSRKELFGIATQFSSFAKTVAGEGGDAAKVVKEIATRGADFASVFNLDVSEALSKFQSGLAGQSEPLRAFGIDLSAAAVEAFAVEQGIIKQGEAMTEQEKVMARYGLLMQQTSMTQGDFKNTSDGLANTQRILKAEFENVKAEVGEALLPVMTDLFMTIRDNLPEIKSLIAEMIKFVPVVVEGALQIFKMREQLMPLIVGFTSATAAVRLSTAALGLFTAAAGGANLAVAAVVLTLGGIAAGMITVYNNTKQATSALEEFNRVQGIKAATSNSLATPEQINAATYKGILDVTPPKAPSTSTTKISVPTGPAKPSTPITTSPPSPININVSVKKSVATGPDIAKAINATAKNVGNSVIKSIRR